MLLVFFVNCLLIISVVLIHFEVLSWLSSTIPQLLIRPRYRVLLALLGSMLAHVGEIWLFGIGYYLLLHLGAMVLWKVLAECRHCWTASIFPLPPIVPWDLAKFSPSGTFGFSPVWRP